MRDFLAHSAIRTKPDFAITEDDIVGVDWASAVTSTPANAEGITVPALVQANTCHYLMVPDEIIFDHLGSKDKTWRLSRAPCTALRPASRNTAIPSSARSTMWTIG